MLVEGQLETRKWQDQSGNDRWSTEVVLRGFAGNFILLDGKDGCDPDRGEQGRDYQGGGQAGTQGYGGGQGGGSALDDDIPF